MAAQLVIQHIPMIVFIVAAIVMMIIGRQAQKTHFDCPVCGCAFKVSWGTYLTAFHMLGKRKVNCPNCGYHGMLSPINDDEK